MKNKYIKGGIEFYIYSEFTNMCAMNYSKISAFKFWGLCVLLMFTMSAQAQFDPEPLLHIHSDFEDTTFNNRRVRHVDLEAKIIQLKTIPGFEVKLLGKSFLGRNIHLVKVGQEIPKSCCGVKCMEMNLQPLWPYLIYLIFSLPLGGGVA